MKAVQINTYGGSEVLELAEVEKPTAQPMQVLVKITASSINPFDVKVTAGYMKEMMPLEFPASLGGDFAGTITELGEDVSEFAVGDEVYGQAQGSYAEFALANIDKIAKKPTNISFEEAAAFPLVGSSAIQALEDHIKLQSGQKILIHGGAGGIGHIAIQMAKNIGAYVATTVSSDDVAFVTELGADKVIDYKKEKFEELLTDFDAVYDTVGGETTNKSFQILKKGGVLVTMLGQFDQALADQHEVTAIGQMTQTNATHLARLKELIEKGNLKITIDSTFPLDKIKEAFDKQNAHPRGKVVLQIHE